MNEKSGLDVININKDSEGRWINGEIKWKNTNLNIASVYAPNEAYARAHFFNDLEDLIDDNDWVIGGDFNCNIDNNRIKDVSKIILRNVLQEKDLFDVWNTVYPNDKGYTHFHKATKQPSRIDYLFISSSALNNVADVTVNNCGLSDHSIVCLKLNNPSICHGQGRWICNNSLLKDDDCIFRIESFWNFWREEKDNYDSLAKWWESGKYRIKEIIRDYGKEKSWKEKQHQRDLQKRYNF